MTAQVQLIAANIDTAFIVTSCNLDFNVARLERYIALAFDAGVTPVILLTKPDLCDDPAPYVTDAEAISADVAVLTLNARSDEPASKLAPWCKPGQTMAFLGSSGVGKSTLTNSLSVSEVAATQAIREDDAKGRHTTSHRQLHILPNGCAVLDTPGVRELQLTDAESGVAEVFSDLDDLSTQCRFNDCRHASEPGCAILAALERGDIDEARLARWRKLRRRRPAQHRKPRPAPFEGQGLRQDDQAGKEAEIQQVKEKAPPAFTGGAC
jgi:ribosome biogenesis GTPase